LKNLHFQREHLEAEFLVGKAPGFRSQSYFGGVGSSLDSAVAAEAALAKLAHRGKMPLPQKT
jgi:hypothetical protein